MISDERLHELAERYLSDEVESIDAPEIEEMARELLQRWQADRYDSAERNGNILPTYNKEQP